MIKRFEDEFPETRLQSDDTTPPEADQEPQISPADSFDLTSVNESQRSDHEAAVLDGSDDEYVVRPVLSRHNSDVSIASKALSQEEGRMHRFGQKFRRDIIKAEGPEREPGDEDNAEHIQYLQAVINGIGGDELQLHLQNHGHEMVLQELNSEASTLRKQLIASDPEGWKRFVESQEAAQKNLTADSDRNNESTIE